MGAKSSFSASDRAYLPEQHCPDPLLSSRSSGMCNILTYFPRYGISEICRWIKITRDPHRRRVKNDISSAPKFGDIITTDHKVLSEEGESRNNHRYAVVVQDSAMRCVATDEKPDLHRVRLGNLRIFLGPEEEPKETYRTIS